MFYSRRNIFIFISINILLVIVLLWVFISLNNNVKELKLKQVVILSRHSVRTPLSKNLAMITPQPWPHWTVEPGFLTPRGYLLEGQMGSFFSNWLRYEGILHNWCPVEEDFFVYANSLERTMSSAKAFVEKGFPNCTINIHHTSNQSDPVFGPFIHNSTAEFKEIALKEMKSVFHSLNLNSSFENLENILNYTESDLCKLHDNCNMITDKNKFDIIVGKKPKIYGPLKLSNEAIDSFLMEYYNGLPDNEIAWGKLNHLKLWRSILSLSSGYHNVEFNTTHIARDIARPLIEYMTDIFLNKSHMVSLLMGHDSNINVILNALRIKPFILKDSFTQTPVGGKVVFQKWLDSDNNRHLLKIYYVYQTNKQLRDGLVLSLDNPPQFHLLELQNCKIDDNGFCLWDDFIMFLKNLWL